MPSPREGPEAPRFPTVPGFSPRISAGTIDVKRGPANRTPSSTDPGPIHLVQVGTATSLEPVISKFVSHTVAPPEVISSTAVPLNVGTLRASVKNRTSHA